MNRTAQREAILRELRALKTHPTADELYEIIRRKLPQISLGTVYRNLDQMSQMGMIRKLSLSGHQKRFDGDLSRHYHVRCPQCDAVSDVPGAMFSQIEKEFKSILPQLGCDGYYFELQGRCPACRAEKDALVG